MRASVDDPAPQRPNPVATMRVTGAAWASKSDPGMGVPEALCRRVTRTSDKCTTVPGSTDTNQLFLFLDRQEVCARHIVSWP